MRTFIAIEPPEEILQAIDRLCRILAPQFPGVRWTRAGNIHLTLRFLGEIPPESLEKLEQAAGKAVQGAAPFSLSMSKVGCFGSGRSPRIVWLGLESSPALASLSGSLEQSLEDAGFGKADKPFSAHLTLARIKRPLRTPPDWDRIAESFPAAWPAWEADRVSIIKSTLTPEGPVYEILKELPLKS